MIDFEVVVSYSMNEVLKRKLVPALEKAGYTLKGVEFEDVLDGQFCFAIVFCDKSNTYIAAADFSPFQTVETFCLVATSQETGKEIEVPITV